MSSVLESQSHPAKPGLEPSLRTQRVAASPTMAIDARAKELAAQGRDVVNFGAGEPDFPSPSHIRQAASQALEGGQTKYTPAAGTPALRRAIAKRATEDSGVPYQPNQVVVSVGAKHSVYNALMALVNPGDGVLLPAPYWVTYPEQIRLADGEVVPAPVGPDEGFRLTRAALERAWAPHVRGLILNSPSNPTGAVIRPEDLTEIAEWCRARDLWVISDEIYGRLVYGDARHLSIAGLPGMAERTVYINGFSKAYSMTGWRLGYACAPTAVASAMSRLQSQSTSNPTTFAQAGALAALEGPDAPVVEMVREFSARRDLALRLASAIPHWAPVVPEGAFYLWIDLADLAGRVVRGRVMADGDALAELLLEEAEVAVVPGAGFGRPQGIRISFATSRERIEEGFRRMAALIGA